MVICRRPIWQGDLVHPTLDSDLHMLLIGLICLLQMEVMDEVKALVLPSLLLVLPFHHGAD
jgi:hypothetical protein